MVGLLKVMQRKFDEKIIGLKFISELVACLTLNFTTVIMLAHTVSFYKKNRTFKEKEFLKSCELLFR